MRESTVRWQDVLVVSTIVALVNAGLVKASPLLAWLPVDLTVLLAGATGLALALHALRRGGALRIHPYALLFIATFLPAWFIAELDGYGSAKLLGAIVTLLALLAGFFLVHDAARRRLLLYAIVVAGGLSLVASRILSSDADLDRVSLDGATTIATGRVAGAALVVLAVFAMTSASRWWLAIVALTIGLATLMIATGARGPVVAAAIAVLLVGLLGRSRGKILRLLLVAVAIAAAWAFIQSSDTSGAERIEASLSGELSSTATREGIWRAAIEAMSNPFGTGWGNFASVLDAGTLLDSGERQYAHNVLLEVFVEGGWLAGAATVIFLGYASRKAWRASVGRDGAALLGVLAFTVLNGLVSGDINDNRLMWTVAAVAAALPAAVDAIPRPREADLRVPAAVPTLSSKRS